jgi:2-polyprenyl-3-methyl-5-hydroxy-6-metoxy-1,4-benzoquinol methylase
MRREAAPQLASWRLSQIGQEQPFASVEKHLARLKHVWQSLTMGFDYEEYYRENRHGLGEPTSEFVKFFENYEQKRSRVLDVGCGQGRDALFVARIGHHVTAIDLSPSGISDLQKDAAAEGLPILAEVVDIRTYTSGKRFDVIVIDRTLHMLAGDERSATLGNLLGLSKRGTHILIADERSNLPAFREIFSMSRWNWTTTLDRRGFLFVQRD